MQYFPFITALLLMAGFSLCGCVTQDDSSRGMLPADEQGKVATERWLREMRLPGLTLCAPVTIGDFIAFMALAAKDFDDPSLPKDQRGGLFFCTPEAEGRSFPVRTDAAHAVIPCLCAQSISFYEALQKACELTDCRFEIASRSVEIDIRREPEDAAILAWMKATRLPVFSCSPLDTLQRVLTVFQEATCAKDRPEGITFICRDSIEGDLPSIKATDISVYDAFRLVCDVMMCSWSVKDGIVIVNTSKEYPDDWITRIYSRSFTDVPRDWLQWLKAKGVKLPEGTAASYDVEQRSLRITSTRRILDLFEKVVLLDGGF